jgi:hypothetical protein
MIVILKGKVELETWTESCYHFVIYGKGCQDFCNF